MTTEDVPAGGRDRPDPPVPGGALMEPPAARAAGERVALPPALSDLNVFRLLLRRGRVAKATGDLLLSLMFGAVLDARLRELVVMRVAWRTASEYEWAQHWRIATEAGVPGTDLAGVRSWPHHGFEPAAQAVLSLADEITETGVARLETLEALDRLLGPDATLEAVLAAAAWTMVSTVLRSMAVPLEAGTAAWPPDGAVPAGAS